MTTAAVSQRIPKLSPRFWGRIAGLCETLEGATSAYGQVIVLGKIVVFDNAAITAANVLAHDRLLRLGFAASLVGVIFHLAWAALFYRLFKPVSRRVSLFAAFVILAGCAIQAVTCVLYIGPMAVLNAGTALSGFTAEQLHALALTLFKINAQSFDTYLVFFGLWCVLNGYLIFRSTFMPRILGILLTISGIGWMIFLYPPFANSVFHYIAMASALGELPLQLWLLIMGVNSEKWETRATAAGLPLTA